MTVVALKKAYSCSFLDVTGARVSQQQLHQQLGAQDGLEDRLHVLHQHKIIPTQLGPANTRQNSLVNQVVNRARSRKRNHILSLGSNIVEQLFLT